MAVRSCQVSRGTGKVFEGDFGKRFRIARRWCAALGTGELKAIGHVDVLKVPQHTGSVDSCLEAKWGITRYAWETVDTSRTGQRNEAVTTLAAVDIPRRLETSELSHRAQPKIRHANIHSPTQIAPQIREECKNSKECAPAAHHFQACADKVEAGKGWQGGESRSMPCVRGGKRDVLVRGRVRGGKRVGRGDGKVPSRSSDR